MALDRERFLALTRADGEALLAAADGRLGERVPSCPDWDVADLVWHIGGVHHFWVTIAEKGGVEFTGVEPATRPDDGNELVAWARGQLAKVIEVLAAADPDTPLWTWTDQKNFGFVQRRMAQETAVHRWDAEAGAFGIDKAQPIDTELAVDGIDEMLQHFTSADRARAADARSLHLHATDTDGEWMIRYGGDQYEWERGHAKGDTAVRGTASNLLLALWGRRAAEDARLETIGDGDGLDAFRAVTYQG